MTHITPLALGSVTDPEMLELIAQAQSLGVPDDVFLGLAARAPEQGKPVLRALMMSFSQGSVDHRLKEVMRILLARFANDAYFASLRSRKAQAMGLTEQRIEQGCSGYEDPSHGFSEAEIWALRFADLMYLDAAQIDKTFYDNMKRHWSEAQIMELGSFMVCHYGMQMFMRSMTEKQAAPLSS